ncbi:MAG: ABC transporter permease [Firmicutes bacterium]|nr:ABC transporter permease [Bacillota bacterium]
MKFRILKSMIKQGFVGMWRNRMMSLASIGSVTSALMILGMVLILILNINNVTNMTKEQFDEIHIYLKEDITDEQIDTIENEIQNYEGVLSVVFQSKEQALEIMKKRWGEESDLLNGLEENPFPRSYIIQLEDIKYADNVVSNLEGLSGIDKIKYFKDIVKRIISVSNVIKNGSLIVIGILMLISIFIISNTIKITVAARKKEINIMKYVGATNGYIRGPFIIEGILLGTIGSALAVILVDVAYQYIYKILNNRLYVFVTSYMVPSDDIFIDVVIIFMTIGIGIGILGSIISLRRFLRV